MQDQSKIRHIHEWPLVVSNCSVVVSTLVIFKVATENKYSDILYNCLFITT